jgi:hypothetical protein
MPWFAIYRVYGGKSAGNVDFLDEIEAESFSGAESIAAETYECEEGDSLDIDEVPGCGER